MSQATFDVFGAQGGSERSGKAGGFGGGASATISVAPGDTLQVNVGGAGGSFVGGSGNSFDSGGGGGGGGGGFGSSGVVFNSGVRSGDGLVTIKYTAPMTVADSYTTNEDTLLAGNVLSNDSDDDGDTLEAALVDDVDNGSLTLNPDGSFSYEPNADYNGPDSFTYKASDGTDDSNVATVAIYVGSANDAPTVTGDGGGSCGSASDMRGTINLTLSDPDEPPESLTLTATSSNRSLLPNRNISFGGGTDASRTMTVSSLTGSGTSNVTITLSDGDLQGTVLVRVISGSASNNTLTGSVNADMIFAGKGSDTVSAQGANDLMCGGNGNDTLTGGLGADHFVGGSGTNTATDFNAGQGDTMAGIP